MIPYSFRHHRYINVFSKLIQTSEDIIFPITRNETKKYLRVEDVTDDKLIDNMIKSATQLAEQYTKRSLVTKTWQIWYDHFPQSREFRLYNPIVTSVESIQYYNINNVPSIVPANDYILGRNTSSPSVSLKYNRTWPDTLLRPVEGVSIDYTAGYGPGSSDVPRIITEGMFSLIGYWYEHRETKGTMPMGVKLAWNTKKVWNF